MTQKVNSTQKLPKVLWDDYPLVVSPGLVMALSSDSGDFGNALVDAFLLQQIHYWMGKAGGAVIDGVKWIYSTYQEWQDQLPFFSLSTIGRAIARLKLRNLILVERRSDKNWNQINWYTINYEALKALWLERSSDRPSSGSRHERFKPAILNRSSIVPNNSLDKSSDISLPLPPQEQREREREENLNLEIPEPRQPDSSFLALAAQETLVPNDDPWLDPTDAPLLDDDKTIKLVENLVVEQVEASVPEDVEDQVPEQKLEPPLQAEASGVGFEKTPPRRQQPTLQKESQKEWEIAPGVPYPAFIKWRSQHYIKQGGHWADAATANAKSEIRNNPMRAQDLWEQFLEYSNSAADTALARRAGGMAPVLPSCFDNSESPTKEQVAGKLRSLSTDRQPTPLQNTLAVRPSVDLKVAPDSAPNGENAQAYATFRSDSLPEPTVAPESFKAKMQELFKAKSMPKSKYQEPSNEIEESQSLIASGNSELIAQAGRKLRAMGATLVYDNNGEVCGFEL